MRCFRSMSRTLWYQSLEDFCVFILTVLTGVKYHYHLDDEWPSQSYATRIKENSALMRYPNQAIGSRPLATIGSCPWVFVVRNRGIIIRRASWGGRPASCVLFSPTPGLRSSADSGHGGKRNQIAWLANVIQSSLLDGSHSTANCCGTRTRRTRTARWSHVINISSVKCCSGLTPQGTIPAFWALRFP